VVDGSTQQYSIFKKCHQEAGHKGREGTYRRIVDHYYWRGIYGDVERWVKQCPECQKWRPQRYQEAALYSFPASQPAWKWHLDVQFMPGGEKRCVLLECRCDLTGWVEAAVFENLTSMGVSRF
ncbi:hypothetical protein QBC32DRAFT_199805, partial [Pseudoneurospora amorphoporcata]